VDAFNLLKKKSFFTNNPSELEGSHSDINQNDAQGMGRIARTNYFPVVLAGPRSDPAKQLCVLVVASLIVWNGLLNGILFWSCLILSILSQRQSNPETRHDMENGDIVQDCDKDRGSFKVAADEEKPNGQLR
jgi:hypothetical protein